MKPYILPICTIALILAGCTSQKPEYRWVKSSNKSQEKDHATADSICIAETYRAAPDSALSDCIALNSNIARNLCLGDQESKAESLRERIYDGCMLGKGWEKQAIR